MLMYEAKPSPNNADNDDESEDFSIHDQRLLSVDAQVILPIIKRVEAGLVNGVRGKIRSIFPNDKAEGSSMMFVLPTYRGLPFLPNELHLSPIRAVR